MKRIVPLLLLATALLSSCASLKAGAQHNNFRLVKRCEGKGIHKGMKIFFYVLNPSGNVPRDLSVKALYIEAGIKTGLFEKMAVRIWYPGVSEKEARALPEAVPQRVTVQKYSWFGAGKEEGVEVDEFIRDRKTFFTIERLAFLEKCIYGF